MDDDAVFAGHAPTLVGKPVRASDEEDPKSARCRLERPRCHDSRALSVEFWRFSAVWDLKTEVLTRPTLLFEVARTDLNFAS